MANHTMLFSAFSALALSTVLAVAADRANQIPSENLLSDHEKIEKLRERVDDLEDRLATLEQKYSRHTHDLRVSVTAMPREIDCNIDITSALVHLTNVCFQPRTSNENSNVIGVLFAGTKDSLVTGPPKP
jgi:hypothetical protein